MSITDQLKERSDRERQGRDKKILSETMPSGLSEILDLPEDIRNLILAQILADIKSSSEEDALDGSNDLDNESNSENESDTEESVNLPPDFITKDQRLMKRLSILSRTHGYLNGIEGVEIGGKTLRQTQKMAAMGFYEWLQSCLLDDELMGRVVHPVGTGKTNLSIMLSEMVSGRTVFIAHSHADKFLDALNDHQATLDNEKRKTVGQCYGGENQVNTDLMVALFPSAHNWNNEETGIDWSSVDLIVVDEADVNALSEDRRNLLKELANTHGIAIVGMSATEEQSSGKKLKDVFPYSISRLSMPDALPKCLEMGITPQMTFHDLYLELRMKVNRDKLKNLKDIPDEDVEDFIRKTNWVASIFEHYTENFQGKPGMLIFRDNKLLDDDFFELAEAHGIRVAAFTGELDQEERKELQEKLANGEIDLLVGSRLLGRGLHIPEVEVVYNSIVSKSPQQFWQANGRGASIDPDNFEKEAQIIAVLPKEIIDESTSKFLPPEERPLCHGAFFEPDYYDGMERLVDLGKRTTIIHTADVEDELGNISTYRLGEYEAIRSNIEVASITRRLKAKPDDYLSRGNNLAQLLDQLEDTELNQELIKKRFIRMRARELRDLTKGLSNCDDQTGYKVDNANRSEWTDDESMETDQMPSVDTLIEFAGVAPVINRTEERELYEMILLGRAEDTEVIEAKRIIAESYLPLIIALAKKMHVDGFDLSDLVHEGVVGFYETLNNQRNIGAAYAKKAGLSGYALIRAFRYIQKLIANEARDIRLPVYIEDEVTKIQRERNDASLNEGKTLSVKEAAKISEKKRYELALRKSQNGEKMTKGEKSSLKKLRDKAKRLGVLLEKWSTNAKMKDAEIREARVAADKKEELLRSKGISEISMIDLAVEIFSDDFARRSEKRIITHITPELSFDEGSDDLMTMREDWPHTPGMQDHYPLTEEPVIHEELRSRVKWALRTLTPREERIVKMRFGIDQKNDEGKTLEELGRDFELTRERIRQFESKALRKLRHSKPFG